MRSPSQSAPKYAFIDALRGYAVLMVITCHTGGMFPLLPYPLKRLTNFGWHGVQLFFLVSCVTLLMSWRHDERQDRASTRLFLLRRFFRIAPMYYTGAVIYYLSWPPPANIFSSTQLLLTLSFLNDWSPEWIPTVSDRWMVVPGGWSIGAEFTFYLIFPVIAVMVRKMWQASLFLIMSVATGCIVNTILYDLLLPSFGTVATSNYLFFSFLNQLHVFALGTMLYLLIERLKIRHGLPDARFFLPIKVGIIAIMLLGIVIAAYSALPQWLSFRSPYLPPALTLASLLFMPFVLLLSIDRGSVLLARPVRLFGKVSFSAYLLHFIVLQKLPEVMPSWFNRSATDFGAIGAFVLLWCAAVPMTLALSYTTYRLIELPMINNGRKLLARRAGDASAGRNVPTAVSLQQSAPGV